MTSFVPTDGLFLEARTRSMNPSEHGSDGMRPPSAHELLADHLARLPRKDRDRPRAVLAFELDRESSTVEPSHWTRRRNAGLRQVIEQASLGLCFGAIPLFVDANEDVSPHAYVRCIVRVHRPSRDGHDAHHVQAKVPAELARSVIAEMGVSGHRIPRVPPPL